VAHAISKSHHLVGAGLQVVHIIGFVALLAAALLLALRQFGLALPGVPRERLDREIGRILWIGLGFAVFSGTLMFISSPLLYFYNRAFEWKLVLLAVAVLVQWLLFRSAQRGLLVAASLALWFGVGIAGRAIGFV
jgi:small-conductance mechanosensitive channel